jgi:hypothetical protein
MAAQPILDNTSNTISFLRGGKTIEKVIPKSSNELVVVPSNFKGTGFLRKYYLPNKEHLGGLLSKKEFDDIIDHSSNLAAKAFSYCKISEYQTTPKYMFISLTISMLCFLSYVFLVYYGITRNLDKHIIIGYILLGVSVVMAATVGVLNIIRKPAKKN